MKNLYRNNVLKIEQPAQGKPVELLWRELGIESEVCKLASNENPLGVSPMAVHAAKEALSLGHFFPDNSCYELRQKLGEILGFPMTNIRIGNGSSQLIFMAGIAALDREDNILMSECSFIASKLVAQIIGCHAKEVPLEDYRHDLDGILAAIDNNTKIVYLDIPMNPIGTCLTRDTFDHFMDRFPEDVLLICDEAYREYADRDNFPETLPLVREGRNVLVLRTLSKLYGLAGFRIGYCLAPEEMIEALRRVSLPFAVNALAQAGAMAALDDEDHVEMTLKITETGKTYLCEQFDRMSIFYIPSETNFVTIDVRRDSREICAGLQKKGVMVRSLAGYGKPTFLRVTVGTTAQNRRFLEALKKLIL